MNAHAGLLDAIREDPDADEPRLILADWLEDHGQAERGELIRLQVVLARLPTDHDVRPGIDLRVRELLHLHRADWSPTRIGSWEFARGFPETLTVPLEDLLDAPDEFLNCGTVRRLVTSFDPVGGRASRIRDLAPFARLAGLRSVRSVELRDTAEAANFVDLVFGSTNLSDLDELCIRSSKLIRRQTQAIVANLGRLRSLALSRTGVAGSVVANLPETTAALESLALDDDDTLSGQAVAGLLSWAGLAGLKRLSLRGIRWAGIAVTAPSRSLESLDLTGSEIEWDTDAPLRRLAITVDLTFGLERWLSSLSSLESLEIECGEFPPDSLLRTLSSSECLARVHRLSLSLDYANFDLSELFQGPNAARWRTLIIRKAGLGSDDVRELAARPELRNLRELSLSHSLVNDEGARALVESPHLGRLVSLDLSGNQITDAGIFVGSPLANPAILDLDGNPIETGKDELRRAGLDLLRRRPPYPIADLLREVMP